MKLKLQTNITNRENIPPFILTNGLQRPGFANLHRNVFFRGEKVPDVIFSALNSNKPEDLWTWMEATEKIRCRCFCHQP